MQIAVKCPKKTVLKHRMAEGTSHLGKEYKNRWCRILSNLNLNDEQQVRSTGPCICVALRNMACAAHANAASRRALDAPPDCNVCCPTDRCAPLLHTVGCVAVQRRAWSIVSRLLQERIVAARRAAIDKLKATYEERGKLNQQAVYFMTHAFSPAAHALLGTSQSDDSVFVRMRAAEKYGECAQHSPMYSVLSELRDNLKHERKQFLHMHEVIVKQARRHCLVRGRQLHARTVSAVFSNFALLCTPCATVQIWHSCSASPQCAISSQA